MLYHIISCSLHLKRNGRTSGVSITSLLPSRWAESENVPLCRHGLTRPTMTCYLSHTEILIWLSLRQDQVDDRDQCREEAQDQGEVVEGAHQEERVAQRVDEVDQRLGAQVGASKGTLQGLSWHGSCHGSQCTQRSRGSRFQAAVLLGLNEGRRHHLPAQHQRRGTQAHAQHAASSMASHSFQTGDLNHSCRLRVEKTLSNVRQEAKVTSQPCFVCFSWNGQALCTQTPKTMHCILQ